MGLPPPAPKAGASAISPPRRRGSEPRMTQNGNAYTMRPSSPFLPMQIRILAAYIVLLCSFGMPMASAATTPVIATTEVEPGAWGVHMLSYQLEKGCISGETVRGMTLVYEGASFAEVSRLYVKVNGKTIPKKRSFDEQSQTLNLSFARREALNICSGGVIDIYADLYPTAKVGSTHQLYVEFESDVHSYTKSVGVPTKGKVVTIVGTDK